MLPDQETGDNQLSDLYAAVQAVIALADPVSARNRSLEIGEATWAPALHPRKPKKCLDPKDIR